MGLKSANNITGLFVYYCIKQLALFISVEKRQRFSLPRIFEHIQTGN